MDPIAYKHEIEKRLAALPATRDEIVALFQASGIKGERVEASKCPVAVYLLKDNPAPENHKLYVGIGHVELTDSEYCSECDRTHWARVWSVNTPQAVDSFIRHFDREDTYPELVETENEP